MESTLQGGVVITPIPPPPRMIEHDGAEIFRQKVKQGMVSSTTCSMRPPPPPPPKGKDNIKHEEPSSSIPDLGKKITFPKIYYLDTFVDKIRSA